MIPQFDIDAAVEEDGRMLFICEFDRKRKHYSIDPSNDDEFKTLCFQVKDDFDGLPLEAIKRELGNARMRESRNLPTSSGPAVGEEKKRGDSQAQRLLQIIDEVELWHSAGTEEAFATVTTPIGTQRNLKVEGIQFKKWLAREYFKRVGRPAGKPAIEEVIGIAAALAVIDGPAIPVFIRIAFHEAAIYVDLADEEFHIVQVTADGWELIQGENCPVMFFRPPGMLPLPLPKHGGSVNDLRALVNVPDDNDWRLLLGWLVGVYHPTGPYAVLVVSGEQGTGKSFLGQILRRLVDPSDSPQRMLPKKEQDLMIAAKNNRVLLFDNLSRISPEISDALCMIATGGGYAGRRLYTDDDEARINVVRPMMMNGIGDVATRPDLADRSYFIELPVLPPKQRIDSASMWKRFEETHAALLGALFDAVACALGRLDSIELPEPPRMADAARWATAAEPALGMADGDFMRAHRANRALAASITLESFPVAIALAEFIRSRQISWRGTATELLQALNLNTRFIDVHRPKDWPQSPKYLSESLKRAAPLMRDQGIEVVFLGPQGHDNRRIIEVSIRPPASAVHTGGDTAIGAIDAIAVEALTAEVSEGGLVLDSEEEVTWEA